MFRFSLLICFFSVFVCYSGDTEYSFRIDRYDLAVSTDLISVEMPSSLSYGDYQDVETYGKVSLKYNRELHSDLNFGSGWRFTVQFKEYVGGIFTSNVINLVIESSSEGFVYSDYHVFDLIEEVNGVQPVRELEITSIIAEVETSPGTFGAAQAFEDLPADIHLELSVKTNRYYKLDEFSTYYIKYDDVSGELRWPFMQGAESYDLEWVFIDKYSAEYNQIATSILDAETSAQGPGIEFYDNYNGSLPFELKEPTRVNLSGNQYSLDLTYPEGVLYFRVRPVGRYILDENPNLDFESVKPGDWTYTTTTQTGIGSAVDLTHLEITQALAFGENQNWLYGINFAENAKSVSTLSYYDGSFRGRQGLTYNTSDDITLVGESKFDYEGRQTVSVIPAPIEGKNFSFQQNFNEVNNGGIEDFEKQHFDNNNPLPLYASTSAEAKGSGQYFSAENKLTNDPYRDAIPNAYGYTYTQVKFNRDATGRISESSGIGAEFAMGSDHTVKYYYGTTNEVELHRLFGKEVGEANNYKKNTVLDPNGQATVSYVDNHGRVIASALSGSNPTNLIELEGVEELDITTALSTDNVESSELIKASKEVYVFYGDNPMESINYDFDGVIYGAANPLYPNDSPLEVLCIECEYELTIEVLDPNGASFALVTASFSNDLLQSCNASPGPVNYSPSNNSITITLPAQTVQGEYTINKILKVIPKTLEDVAAIIESALGSEEDFINEALLNVDISGCFDDCDSYCTYLAEITYEASIPAPTTPWAQLSESVQDGLIGDQLAIHCNEDEIFNGDGEDQEDIVNGAEVVLGTAGGCEGIKLQMQTQVSPGGAEYESQDFWNLFPSDVTALDLYTSYDANGVADGTLITDPLDLQITTTFQEEWIPALLPYHREYCHYDVCLQLEDINGESSNQFDIQMQQTGPWSNYYSSSMPGTAGVDFTSITSPDPYMGSAIDALLAPNTFDVVLSTFTYGCASGSGDLNDYVNDFWTCNSITSGDAWDVYYGMYQNLKQVQINAYKTYLDGQTDYAAGCLYYDDGNEIVPYTVLEDQNNDNVVDASDIVIYNNDNQANGPNLFDIQGQCDLNVTNWMSNLGVPCQNEITTAAISGQSLADLEDLMGDYCVEASLNGVVGGWFFDPTTVNPTISPTPTTWITAYTDIVDFLDDVNYPSCNTSNFEIITPGNNSSSLDVTSTPMNVPSACLLDMMELINEQLLPANNLSTVVAIPASLSSCASGDLVFGGASIISATGTPVCGGGDNSIVIALDLDQNAVDLTNVVAIENLSVSQTILTFAYVDYVYSNGDVKPGILRLGPCFNSNTVNVIEYNYESTSLPSWTEDCINQAYVEAILLAQTAYHDQSVALLNSLTEQVNCLDDVVEDYRLSYVLKEYQYTLFYYDQAGNLVATVPPEGVHPLANTAFTPEGVWLGSNPIHEYVTLYEYNGANSLTFQKTPDGGETNYYYDDLYRLRFSQNAQQALDDKFSYTLYDELGRITEAGEAGDGDNSNGYAAFTTEVNNYSYPQATLKRDHVKTFYEDVYDGVDAQLIAGIAAKFANGQENLRNRIGAVVQYTADYQQLAVGSPSIEPVPGTIVEAISSYSYDFHGNVKVLVQTNSHLKFLGHEHKKIEYEYELISGNVKEVVYERDAIEEWRHRYHYDANNRLVRAFTSDDGEEWEMDSKYFYYLHGPMARKEIGHDKVQGCDYVYNLQGWLKGVNSTTLNTAYDAGKDAESGDLDAFSGADAMGFSLGYFQNDYSEIGGTNYFANTSDLIMANGNHGNLYNGNISHMVTAMKDENEEAIDFTGNIYQYDQLQRIKGMKVYTPFDQVQYVNDNNWNNAITLNPGVDGTSYETAYSYDKNGNLKTLQRNNASGVMIDDFQYKYNTGSNPKNNQLEWVDDLQTDDLLSAVDVDDQALGNYTYNDIGQLTEDVKEGIEKIEWTVTGKVKRITFTAPTKPNIEFVYDAMGNRIMKVEGGVNYKTATYTYYVYDASGNVMTTYSRTSEPPTGVGHQYILDELSLGDQMIYGANRTGTKKKLGDPVLANREYDTNDGNPFAVITLSTPLVTYAENFNKEARQLGAKTYELANHLGNVLEVVTDKKVSNTAKDAYEADVVSYSDYYPFGMMLDGRNGSAVDYRYGFQGYESDDEVKGEGNSYTTTFRQYDPRVARWLSIDPVVKEHESPYAAFANSPVYIVDPNGADSVFVNPHYNVIMWEIQAGDTYTEISQRTGVSIKDLKDWNGYEDGALPIGELCHISSLCDPIPSTRPLICTDMGEISIDLWKYSSNASGGGLPFGVTFHPSDPTSSDEFYFWQGVITNDPLDRESNGWYDRVLVSPMQPKKEGDGRSGSRRSVEFDQYDAGVEFSVLGKNAWKPNGKLGYVDRPNRKCIESGEIVWSAMLSLWRVNDNGSQKIITLQYGFTMENGVLTPSMVRINPELNDNNSYEYEMFIQEYRKSTDKKYAPIKF